MRSPRQLKPALGLAYEHGVGGFVEGAAGREGKREEKTGVLVHGNGFGLCF